MNLHPSTIDPIFACELLLKEMNTNANPGSSLAALLEQVNACRIERNLPMASSMSCFNPMINIELSQRSPGDFTLARALWQRGLSALLKKQEGLGKPDMIAACETLQASNPDPLIKALAQTFYSLLTLSIQHEVLIELSARFDRVLKQSSDYASAPAENLLRDCLFYVTLKEPNPQAWIWTEQGEKNLFNRLAWFAKDFSALLVPHEDSEKIDKLLIQRKLIPLTDALLFTHQIKLRMRLLLRLEKIDERMLKIAVPVQLLMAEALRLSC